MFGLLARLVVFFLWVTMVSALVAVLTAGFTSVERIDQAYVREVRAMRWLGPGVSEEKRIGPERRGLAAGNWIADQIDAIALPNGGSRLGDGVREGVRRTGLRAWWQRQRPHVNAFLPTLVMRLEAFFVSMALACPLLISCYFVGEFLGRKAMAAGELKRESTVNAWKWGFRSVVQAMAIAAGLVVAPPVAWWIVPGIAVLGLCAVQVRRYFPEIV
ncbi:MAG: hypothetical protein PF961_10605 [Planctomycetota bacterium]|jgi:hypothetical protein|nr:hypothetical protein [Planctomycetota bacterium]